MAKKPIAIDAISPELVEQFAPVRVAVDQFRPTVNIHDRLCRLVKLCIEKQPGDKPVTLRGKTWVIELDPYQIARKVRPVAAVFEGLKKLFGLTRYFELLDFPVTPIDAMCTEDEAKTKAFIDSSQTGSRKIIGLALIDDVAKKAKAA